MIYKDYSEADEFILSELKRVDRANILDIVNNPIKEDSDKWRCVMDDLQYSYNNYNGINAYNRYIDCCREIRLNINNLSNVNPLILQGFSNIALSAVKQGVVEATQSYLIHSICEGYNLNYLFTGSGNLNLLIDGSIVEGGIHKSSDKFSIDGYITDNIRLNIYLSYKRGSGPGGSQSHNYKDQQKFLISAAKSSKENKFIAICDGPYYFNNKKIVEELNARQQENVYAITTDELPETLEYIIKNEYYSEEIKVGPILYDKIQIYNW